jgi:NAD(P)H-dependent FMN reductase
MAARPKILVFAGSTRKASFNRKLAARAAHLIDEAGAQATLIELADYPMPIYNGDLEAAEGLPEAVKRLKALFADHDGLFIACPEYNSSITPLLKNTIDWLTRKESPDEPSLVAFRGKVAALGAASDGRLGGLRVLVVMRMLLTTIQVHTIPQQVAVHGAAKGFAEDGSLEDKTLAGMLDRTVMALVETTKKMSGT